MVPRWVDVFPWLKSMDASDSASFAGNWPNEAVDSDPFRRTELIDLLAELMITRMDRWTIGQLMPRLQPGTPIERLIQRTSTRTGNMLQRQGYRCHRDIFQEEVRDLLQIRNAGIKTVKELLAVLVVECLEAQERPSETDRLSGEPIGSSRHEGDTLTSPAPRAPDDQRPGSFLSREAEVAVLTDTFLVARWLRLRGDLDQPLLSRGGVSPAEIDRARERLLSLTSLDVLPHESASDLPKLITDALLELDTVDVLILRDRVFADHPVTLDIIARRVGLTRERIRQRESKAVTFLNSLGSEVPELSWVFEAARNRIGALLPLEILLAEFPALAQEVTEVAQPAWRIIDRLDDDYEIEDGWCVAGTMSLAKRATRVSLDELADSNGLVPVEDLGKIGVFGTGVVPPWALTWLEFCGAMVIKDAVLTRTSSLQDRAAAALAVHGEPYTLEGFPSFVLSGRSERSLSNALAADPRFVRVDRIRWALAEWGQGEYTGIADAIRRELESSGGAAPLARIVTILCGRYDIAEGSVRAYASAPPFSVKDGIVRQTTISAPKGPRKTWQQSRRVYKRGDEWLFRFTVNRDHVRGSGSPCPVALAVQLGVPPGGQRHFSSGAALFGVHWKHLQPALGSVGPFIRELDSALGDEVILSFRAEGNGTVQATGVDPSADHPWIAAARLSGALVELTPDAAHQYLAQAVGAAPSASTADLVAILERRREDDLAQLVLLGAEVGARKMGAQGPGSPRLRTGVDEILELL